VGALYLGHLPCVTAREYSMVSGPPAEGGSYQLLGIQVEPVPFLNSRTKYVKPRLRIRNVLPSCAVN